MDWLESFRQHLLKLIDSLISARRSWNAPCPDPPPTTRNLLHRGRQRGELGLLLGTCRSRVQHCPRTDSLLRRFVPACQYWSESCSYDLPLWGNDSLETSCALIWGKDGPGKLPKTSEKNQGVASFFFSSFARWFVFQNPITLTDEYPRLVGWIKCFPRFSSEGRGLKIQIQVARENDSTLSEPLIRNYVLRWAFKGSPSESIGSYYLCKPSIFYTHIFIYYSSYWGKRWRFVSNQRIQGRQYFCLPYNLLMWSYWNANKREIIKGLVLAYP